MKILHSWVGWGLLGLVTACSKDESAFTVVQGRVIDKHTGRGMPRVKLQVYKHYPTFTFVRQELVGSALTDSRGEYALSFTATGKPKNKHCIRLIPSDSVADLTTYLTPADLDDGLELQKGKSNQFDFEATPYKTVTVHVNASKGGKNYLSVFCHAIDPGVDSRADIFTDTVRANQRLVLTRTVRLLPMRTYRFEVVTANRVRYGNRNYDDYLDLSPIIVRTRPVHYNDTTSVTLR